PCSSLSLHDALPISPRQVLLLVLFDLCFVLPLLGIIGTLTFASGRADQVLGTCRRFLRRTWPTVLSIVLMLAGVFVVLLGATGLDRKSTRLNSSHSQ